MAAKNKQYRGPGYSPCRPRCAMVCLILGLIPVIYFTYNWHYSQNDAAHNDLHNIMARGQGQHVKCEDLYRNSGAEKYVQSKDYTQTVSNLAQALRQPSTKVDVAYYNSTPLLYGAINSLVDTVKAKRVCIVGSNMNLVALHTLEVNRKLYVHWFRRQTGESVTKKLEEYLKRRHNSRLYIYDGDTVESLPKFSATNLNKVYCDVMVVNGPVDYNVAKADVTNIARLARMRKNFIVFVQNKDLPGYGLQNDVRRKSSEVWNESKMTGLISEKLHCDFKTTDAPSNAQFKGFKVGTVLRMPEKRDIMSPGSVSNPVSIVEVGRSVGPVAQTNVRVGANSDNKLGAPKPQIPSSLSKVEAVAAGDSKQPPSSSLFKSPSQQSGRQEKPLKFGPQGDRINLQGRRNVTGFNRIGQRQGSQIIQGSQGGQMRSNKQNSPDGVRDNFGQRRRMNGTRVGPNGGLRGNVTGRVRRLRVRPTKIVPRDV